MSKLIAVESIDGAGGTTVAEALTSAMRDNDIACHKTTEPTGTPIGSLLRKYGDTWNPMQQLFMFLADRAAHQDSIKLFLDDDKHVVCDRYIGSTVAYQSKPVSEVRNEEKYETMDWIDGLHDDWCVRPDITVWIDTHPSEVKDRLDGDVFEDPDIQVYADVTYQQYYNFGVRPDVIRIRGNQSEEQMIDDAVSRVMKQL